MGPTSSDDTRLEDMPDRVRHDREEEEARVQRWDAFVTWAKTAAIWMLVDLASQLMRITPDERHVMELTNTARMLLDFEETEHWSGVLAALSCALREEGR